QEADRIGRIDVQVRLIFLGEESLRAGWKAGLFRACRGGLDGSFLGLVAGKPSFFVRVGVAGDAPRQKKSRGENLGKQGPSDWAAYSLSL
ncbi:MAG: hypothetical protein K2P00_05075, partial [Alistipes sp.]|nr:hypothetical protein [Alistipes sp.]